MEPSNPWLRFFVGLVVAAIAIRVTVELIRPVLGFLITAIVIVGLVIVARWWRANRW
jgi:hypothetical protein